MTQDSIGHLKMLYMSVLSLSSGSEPENATAQRSALKKCLAFEYASSFIGSKSKLGWTG